MSRTPSAAGPDRLASVVRAAKSVLLLTHSRPDGDGLGSVAGLARCALRAGKDAAIYLPEPVPRRYEFLFETDVPLPLSDGPFAQAADRAELILIADTASYEQLDGLEEALRARREKVAVLDHHQTADDIAPVGVQDTTASATGILVGELIGALGWPLETQAAEALAAAVLSDTGWFRFSNTDARTLRAVADWLEAGVRLDVLYRRLYQSDRVERVRLLQRVLASLELHADGRLAVMSLRRDDFARTGASEDETENLINESLRLETVELAALLVERDGEVRVSLRSRNEVDVSQVAKGLGGGGHARAAGCRVTGDVDDVRPRLIDACRHALAAAAG